MEWGLRRHADDAAQDTRDHSSSLLHMQLDAHVRSWSGWDGERKHSLKEDDDDEDDEDGEHDVVDSRITVTSLGSMLFIEDLKWSGRRCRA